MVRRGGGQDACPVADESFVIRLRLFRVAVGVAVVTSACAGGTVARVGGEAATVVVVDEAGRPVPGAVVAVHTGQFVTDSRGEVDVAVDGPAAGTVSAVGMLDEPIIVAPGNRSRVKMWARRGPGGSARIAMHLGGDVMLGRRYLEPAREGTARVVEGDGGASARAVMADVAPLLRAADVTTVNLETVVGDPPPEGKLQGKRFTLRSPAETVAMLESAGVDVAVLGNNHAYDWGDGGLVSTTDLLSQAGIAFTGAGATLAGGRRPAIVDTPGGRVTILSYSTVNGDYVNDQLPSFGPTSARGRVALVLRVGASATRRGGDEDLDGPHRPGCVPRAAGLGSPTWTRGSGALRPGPRRRRHRRCRGARRGATPLRLPVLGYGL